MIHQSVLALALTLTALPALAQGVPKPMERNDVSPSAPSSRAPSASEATDTAISAREFNDLDANKDGSLSKKELGPTGEYGAFSSLDTNGDGQISENEFRARPMDQATKSPQPKSDTTRDRTPTSRTSTDNSASEASGEKSPNGRTSDPDTTKLPSTGR